MTETLYYPERDERGRFVPGNSLASHGGRTRARTLTPDRRRHIASLGFHALVDRRFGGDRQAAVAWLTAKGQHANDQHYPPQMRVFPDPGPMPGGKEFPA
jgi:hypothetical protein